jgi:hypothetical protein
MGLDVSLFTDNYNELSELKDFELINEHFQLSREFCNLICRNDVIESGIPELDQISLITGCDISFIYKMKNYTPDWELEEMEEYENEQTIISIKKSNLELNNNIDEALVGVKCLISSLNNVEDLEQKLNKTEFDTIGIDYYFSDFKMDKGDGYLGNNFGQDLRNFEKFLHFAKNKSANTVFFQFG